MTATTTATDPYLLPESGIEMSNFDLVIPNGMEAALRSGQSGAHPAWDHWGIVWYEGGLFWEQVKRYREVVDIVSAATLEELMALVNARWGRD